MKTSTILVSLCLLAAAPSGAQVAGGAQARALVRQAKSSIPVGLTLDEQKALDIALDYVRTHAAALNIPASQTPSVEKVGVQTLPPGTNGRPTAWTVATVRFLPQRWRGLVVEDTEIRITLVDVGQGLTVDEVRGSWAGNLPASISPRVSASAARAGIVGSSCGDGQSTIATLTNSNLNQGELVLVPDPRQRPGPAASYHLAWKFTASFRGITPWPGEPARDATGEWLIDAQTGQLEYGCIFKYAP